MKEAVFLKKNAEKWQKLALQVKSNNQQTDPNQLAYSFIELTDDLAFAKTFYPNSKTVAYLNNLSAQFHQQIYKNKQENKKRVWLFWKEELPLLLMKYKMQCILSLFIFIAATAIGMLSAKYDDNFVRIILGDDYVNTTLQNIEDKNPFGIYKKTEEWLMFLMIGYNNIRVSFLAFVSGITGGIGTIWLLLNNGIMFGSFMQFFFNKSLGSSFLLVVLIHGIIELWSIVIAGAAGLIMAKGLLFPNTFSRKDSLTIAAKDAVKIVFGQVPFFVIAALLESFITRKTDMPIWVNICILAASFLLIIIYFVWYPKKVYTKFTGKPTTA